MTNMTYAMALEVAINAVADEAVVEKLTALKGQLEKRSTKKTPTKNQKANEVIMDAIEVALGKLDEPVTVTELIAVGEGLPEGLTNQKVSALLRKMVEARRVVKTIEGKKAVFALA